MQHWLSAVTRLSWFSFILGAMSQMLHQLHFANIIISYLHISTLSWTLTVTTSTTVSHATSSSPSMLLWCCCSRLHDWCCCGGQCWDHSSSAARCQVLIIDQLTAYKLSKLFWLDFNFQDKIFSKYFYTLENNNMHYSFTAKSAPSACRFEWSYEWCRYGDGGAAAIMVPAHYRGNYVQ